MNQELAIGEVARSAGLRPSALRYYESVGILPRTRRINGRRRYDSSVLEDLAFIRLAQRAGFKIREIHALVHDFESSLSPSERWRELARPKLTEVDALIERAETMKRTLVEGIRCGCKSLSECTLTK